MQLAFWLVVLLIGASVITLIATPLHVTVAARFGEPNQFRLEARTFWGKSPRFVAVRSRAGKTEADLASGSKHAKDSHKTDGGHRERKRKRRKTRAKRLLLALPEFLLSELRQIHLEKLRLSAVLGTGDPAETGQVFGTIQALQYALPSRRAEIAIQPDFTSAVLIGSAELTLRVRPISLLPPALLLVRKIWLDRS